MKLLCTFTALSFIVSLCFEMNKVSTPPTPYCKYRKHRYLVFPSARVLILQTEGLNREVEADRECRQAGEVLLLSVAVYGKE